MVLIVGIIYSVACENCKTFRNLSKYYLLNNKVSSRKDAIDLSNKVKTEYTYHTSLLVSFMSDHEGHNVVLYSDLNDELIFNYECNKEYKEDIDYWKVGDNE